MKKDKKLAIKKVTLRDLDDQGLENLAGATGATCVKACNYTVAQTNCNAVTCRKC